MMLSLGQQIRARRLSLGLTLESLAQRAQCTKGYLSAIETGRRKRPPSLDLLSRIESALELDASDLTRQAVEESLPPEARHTLDQLERRAHDAAQLATIVIRGITPAAAEHAIQLAQSLLENASAPSAVIPLPRQGAPPELLSLPVDVPEDAFAIRIDDDSMAPVYRPDDIVIVAPDNAPPPAADCLVVFSDDARLFRRCFPSDDRRLRLQPLNHFYPPAVPARADIATLAPALYHIRKTLPADSP